MLPRYRVGFESRRVSARSLPVRGRDEGMPLPVDVAARTDGLIDIQDVLLVVLTGLTLDRFAAGGFDTGVSNPPINACLDSLDGGIGFSPAVRRGVRADEACLS